MFVINFLIIPNQLNMNLTQISHPNSSKQERERERERDPVCH